MAQVPGTVSKILWHFTGGPKWDTEKKCQQRQRKPESAAYDALLSILKERELKIGQYREVVRVELQRLSRRNKITGKQKVLETKIVELESSPVCCLSDIPIAHLSYQARRYGRMAVGFHRDAVVRHGFNPVFYTLQDTRVLRSIRRGFRWLRNIDARQILFAVSDIESKISNLECEEGHSVEAEVRWELDDIRLGIKGITDDVSIALDSFERFLAFVKTFDPQQFSTIYCEREWRSTEPFPFSKSDVAMVVLPNADSRGSYFRKFVRQTKKLKLSRSIPIVPWEDLIEH